MALSNILNLKSNEVANNYQNSLKFFKSFGKHFNLYSSNKHLSLIPMELMLFSPTLCDIFNSMDAFETPTIMMPDSSHTSIFHLLNILTLGFTTIKESNNLKSHVVKEIILSGKMLGINISNLFLDTRKHFVSEKSSHIKKEYAEFEKVKEIAPLFNNNKFDIKEEELSPFSVSCKSFQISNNFKSTIDEEKSKNSENVLKYSMPKENFKKTNPIKDKKSKEKSKEKFTCQKCNYITNHEEKLRKHDILNHSLEKVLRCYRCQFATNAEFVFKRHFEEMHNVQVEICLLIEGKGFLCKIREHFQHPFENRTYSYEAKCYKIEHE